MAFTHGGGAAYGGSHDTDLNAASVLEVRSDVLVVTFNYRHPRQHTSLRPLLERSAEFWLHNRVDLFGFLG